MTYFNDTLTESTGTPLASHTPELGAGWALNTAYNITATIRASDDVVRSDSTSTTPAVYLIDDAPAGSVEYSGESVLEINETSGANTGTGITARTSVSAQTMYVFRNNSGADQWELQRVIGGVATVLDTIPQEFGTPATYTVKLYVTDDGNGDPNFKVDIGGVPQTWTTSGTDTVVDTDPAALTTGPLGIWLQRRNSVISSFTAVDLAAAGSTITVDEYDDGEVFIKHPSLATQAVSISGSYIAAADPAAIRYRLLDAADDTTEIVGWTVLDASPAGGTFNESVNIPEGGWYHVEVDFSDDAGVTALQANDWGIGYKIAILGQSQGENMGTDGTGTPNALLSKFGGSWSKHGTTGAGEIAFGNAIVAATGLPVAIINSCVGGTQLTGGIEWGSDSAGSTYDQAISRITSAGGDLSAVMWLQGEADAVVGAAESTYVTDGTALINTRVRAAVTNGSSSANLPFHLMMLGRRTSGVTDANTQAINNALHALGTTIADAHIGATTHDIPLSDTVHFTVAGYETLAERMAQSFLRGEGEVAYSRGPQIDSAVLAADSLSISVNLTHNGGADFTPATGISGFEPFDDAVAVGVSSVVRSASDQITINLSSAITGTPTLRYMYGATPDVSGVVVDDTALALPLEGLDTFSVSASVSGNGAFSETAETAESGAKSADGFAVFAEVASLLSSQVTSRFSAGLNSENAVLSGSGTASSNGSGAGVIVESTAFLVSGSKSVSDDGVITESAAVVGLGSSITGANGAGLIVLASSVSAFGNKSASSSPSISSSIVQSSLQVTSRSGSWSFAEIVSLVAAGINGVSEAVISRIAVPGVQILKVIVPGEIRR